VPSTQVVPTSDALRVGYSQVQSAFSSGAVGPLQIITSTAQASAAARIASQDPGAAAPVPNQIGGGYALITAIPRHDPSNPAVGRTIDRHPDQAARRVTGETLDWTGADFRCARP